MTYLTPMSELDAVNEMLTSIGQAPVSTLATSAIRDVNVARALLERVSRYVQLYGFAFNTDPAYEISPDIDGYLKVPEGVLKLDPADKRLGIVERQHPTEGRCLYDTTTNSWTFTDALTCKVVWALSFDDLPEAAKAYVAVAASRKFQSRIIGSPQQDRYEAEDEMKAWAALLRTERATRDTNMFSANPSLRASVYNRRY
jgi:hypothetical protein